MRTRIIIISIIIIIISLAISIYMPNKEKLEEKQEDNSISYYLLKRDEKFGVINGTGEVVIAPNYEQIIIPNPHKAVFLCKSEEQNKILNDKSEEIFTQYNNVEPIELVNVITELSYEKNVLKFEKNGKYGLINIDGKIVVEPKYEEISSLGYKEKEVLVKENNKYGIIDEKGNQKIKNIYDSIESDQYYSIEGGYKKSGYIVCNVTNDGYRYGYYDYDGEKVLETEYNQITRLTQVKNTNDIYLTVAKNGQVGIFINNNKIINTQYQSVSYDSGIEMFIVERTGQYGAINEKGLEVLKTEFTDIQVNGIYMYTKKGEEQKIYDNAGREVNLPFETIIEDTPNSEYFIKKENDEYTILNSNFEEILTQKYKYLEYAYNDCFIATNSENKSGVIDSSGNTMVEFKYDLIQPIKEKKAIQAIDFELQETDIYNNEVEKTVGFENMNLENVDDYIKVYNDDEEYYLDNNGNKIIDNDRINDIKQSDAILKIGNFKRVTYGLGQYYYIDLK